MKSGYHILLLLLLAMAGLAGSCSEEKQTTGTEQRQPTKRKPRKSLTVFESPQDNERFITGDAVMLAVKSKKEKEQIDSVKFFVDGQLVATIDTTPFSFDWKTAKAGTGKHTVSAAVYQGEVLAERNNTTVELLSDLEPRRYRYRVLATYPHDEKAWTQGLVYDNGHLYEGTGQKGASSLRKISLPAGDLLKMQPMDTRFFGEGIAVLNNEIFQLTWQAQTGFVYDKQTFALKREFRYPTEGWGLTTDGQYLIMSDGTEKIYFMDPQGFSEVRRISVYTPNGPVTKLNELEYIDGEIYANVWETDNIIRIDPATGKVLGIADMRGLMNRSGMDEQAVLNGIAWDAQGRRLFVTGKWWPKLFQVEFTPQQ